MKRAIFAILFLCLVSAGISAASDNIPDNCETPTEYQHVNWIPRYEYHNQRFILLDYASGEIVMTLEENFQPESFQFLRWSPNCRYIAAKVDELGDLYIWDTVTASRVGFLPDMHGGSWSLDNSYTLGVSENRIVLWHLPTNTSLVLVPEASSFQFTHFAENRVCFEDDNTERDRCFTLDTGQEIAPSLPNSAVVVSESSFSFGNYNCVKVTEGTYQLRNPLTNTQLYLDSDEARLVLREGVRPQAYGIIDPIRQVINENYGLDVYQFRGWSSDCRFAAAAIGAEWQNNTVIWDRTSWQSIATWEDARNGVHGLSWSPIASESLIIQTRDGTFFWQVLSNSRSLISQATLTQILWQPERANFLAVPVGGNGVKIYEIHTGQELGAYHIGERTAPVEYEIQGAWLYMYSTAEQGNRGAALWNLNTGQGLQLAHPIVFPRIRYWWQTPNYWTWRMNPSERYLVALIYEENLAKVWDLSALREDGQPNHIYAMSYIGERNTITWIDDTTLEFGTSLARWSILDGEEIGESSLYVPPQSSPQIVNLPHSNGAYGIGNNGRDTNDFGTCPYNNSGLFLQADPNGQVLRLRNLHSGETSFILEEHFLGRINEISWSPDCRIVMASIGFWQPLGTNGRYHTAAWDTQTGQRLMLWNTGLYRSYWNPNGESVVILPSRFNPQALLWHIHTGESIRIENVGRMSFGRVYWDYGRNQIYANGYAGAFAFDASTGQSLQVFPQSHDEPASFIISPDGNFMAVYTFARGQYDGMTLWNLNTLENWQINVQNTLPYGRDEVQFSPDNRYLAIRFNDIRLWDLQALPNRLQERLPIHILPIADTATWHFDSNTSILTQNGNNQQRWDTTTGQALP